MRGSAPTSFSSAAQLVLVRLAQGDVFFVLEDLLDLVVELLDLRLVDVQLGQPALVVDRHRGAVVHGILDIVDADIVAEHRAGILVVLLPACR